MIQFNLVIPNHYMMPILCSLPDRFEIFESFSLTNCSSFLIFSSNISIVSFICPIVWSFSSSTSGSTSWPPA